MNLIELQHALRQLRLGGIATVLETRLHQAQAEAMAPIESGAAAVVQHNKLRESRRRQARSLSLALAASESYRQYTRRQESAGVA